MAITAIKTLIAEAGAKFSRDMWTRVCQILVRVFERADWPVSADPYTEVEAAGALEQQAARGERGREGELQLDVMGRRHRIRMLLYRLVQDLCCVHSEALGEAQLTQLLNLLTRSQDVGALAGGGAGGSHGTQEQLKMMQEEWAEASQSELRFMLRLYRQASAEPEAFLETRLLDRIIDIFSRYMACGDGGAAGGAVSGDAGAEERRNTSDEQTKLVLAPTVVVVMEGLMALQQQRLARLLPRIYRCVCLSVCLSAGACEGGLPLSPCVSRYMFRAVYCYLSDGLQRHVCLSLCMCMDVSACLCVCVCVSVCRCGTSIHRAPRTQPAVRTHRIIRRARAIGACPSLRSAHRANPRLGRCPSTAVVRGAREGERRGGGRERRAGR